MYTPQVWVDNVTPADAAHMNYMESGIQAAVPADNVVVAGTRILSSKLLAADAQPAFRLKGDGLHEWGPGGATAPDVTMGRTTIGRLQVNGSGFWMSGGPFRAVNAAALDGFNYRPANAGGALIDSIVGAEGFARFWIDANGQMKWGPGSGATDLTLSRGAAGRLTADGSIWAVGSPANIGFVYNPATATGSAIYGIVQGESQPRYRQQVNGTLEFGPGGSSALDTTLWRNAVSMISIGTTTQANRLRVYGTATGGPVFDILRGADTQARILVSDDGKITWGDGASAGDTTLYRGAPDQLRTDDSFYLIGASYIANKALAGDAQTRYYIAPDGAFNWGPGGATAPDTNLYRVAANFLQTDDHFRSQRTLATDFALGALVGGDSNNRFAVEAGGKVWWGPGNAVLDTNLYRDAADTLRTDDYIALGMAGAAQPRLTLSPFAEIRFGPGGSTATDTTLYRFNPAILKTDGQLLVGVSALTGGVCKTTVSTWAGGPPASPGDGDIWIATNVDSSGAVRWAFQYDASEASANKWKFIGGPPVMLVDTSGANRQNTVQNTWQAVPSFPTRTFGRGGQYRYRFGARIQVTTAADTVYLSCGVSAGATYSPYAQLTSGLNGTFYASVTASADDVQIGATRTSAEVMTLYMQTTSAVGNVAIAFGWLEITPVRIA